MGLTRKIMSITTAGAVDFRSDKERIARKTAKGARATKKLNKLIAEQTAAIEAQTAALTRAQQPTTAAPVQPPSVPAGWYPDPQNSTLQRYWDGQTWTADTAPQV